MKTIWTGLVLAASLATMEGQALASSKQETFLSDGWFAGAPAAAFAAAKTERKPLLLYWGAVWCPPCNELKAEVFSKPRFKEIVAPLVALHIDGDQEGAQIWSDKLKITGYPTVVLYDPDGRETMRLQTSVSMDEFEAALAAGIAAGGGVDQAAERALAGKATASDWRLLAWFSWDQSAALEGDQTAGTIARLAKLAFAAPDTAKAERALLAATALAAAAQATDGAAKVAADAVKKDALALIGLVLDDRETVRAARVFVVNYADGIVAYAEPGGAGRKALGERWAKASESLLDDPTVSVDVRLSAIQPRLALYKAANAGATVPESIRTAVATAAARADREAKTPFERKSVVSTAAWMLSEIGDFAGARRLLDAELKRTDTPWYYQSSYASLERAAGNEAAALGWAAKARQSVEGRASRVQWIVEDLAATAKATTIADQKERLRAVTKEYYETAQALPDGFVGRNATRAKRVAETLKPHLGDAALKSLVQGFAAKCPAGAGADGCAKHFAGLLTGA